jgi:AAA family ATP:ADP antiporter
VWHDAGAENSDGEPGSRQQGWHGGDGKRLFGVLTAGGTVGAAAGFGTKCAVERSFETNHLLEFVVGLIVAASLLVLWAGRRFGGKFLGKEIEPPRQAGDGGAGGIGELLSGSRYLKTIAVVILVSVIVSTLIDFQFKTAVKEAHPSKEALAAFFSFYHGWLSIATFFTQFVLTGKALS